MGLPNFQNEIPRNSKKYFQKMDSFVFLCVCGDGQMNAKQAWYVHRLRSWECVYKISNNLVEVVAEFVSISTG